MATDTIVRARIDSDTKDRATKALEPMTARNLDHPLRGVWRSYREAHVEPDRLLIYRVEGNELHLVRTGSHADLFE